MTALSVQPPFPIMTDIDGQPLEDGYIWIGVANLSPITNPITVYWDIALTIPATQPIRTRGGYPVNSGTPARLYAGSDYSIQIQNRNGSVVYTSLDNNGSLFGGTISSVDVTFLQAGSGAVERTAQSKMRDFVSVKDFGAVGDGTADDTAEIQAAFDSLDPVLGGNIFFPPGRYRITATINLPITTSGTGRYEISGYGAEVQTSADIIMFSRTVADNSIALNVIGDRFTVSGLSLTGINPPPPNSWGFKFGPSYTSVFRDCNFLFLNTGLDLLFCLNTIVDGCMATACRQYGFRARNGDWAGVTSSNAGSNVTAFTNCRVFAQPNAIAGFSIEGASGVSLTNCISEGFTQQYGVNFDSQLAGTAKQFYIKNLHTEGSFTGAAVRLLGAGGQCFVDGWFHQGTMAGVPLLDTSGANVNTECILQNLVAPTDNTNLVKCDAPARFVFLNHDWGPMYQTNKWVGGVLPQFLNEQRIADPATEGGGNYYFARGLILEGDGAIVIKSNGGLTLRGQQNQTSTDLMQVATTGGDVTRYITLRNIGGAELFYLPLYASVPDSSQFLAAARNAATIADITSEINTTKKFLGKQVFDVTNNRLMISSGSTAGSTWYRADGGANVTPT